MCISCAPADTDVWFSIRFDTIFFPLPSKVYNTQKIKKCGGFEPSTNEGMKKILNLCKKAHV